MRFSAPVRRPGRDGLGVHSLSTRHGVQHLLASHSDQGWYDLLGERKRHRPSVARDDPRPMAGGVRCYLAVFVLSFDCVGGGVAELGLEAA